MLYSSASIFYHNKSILRICPLISSRAQLMRSCSHGEDWEVNELRQCSSTYDTVGAALKYGTEELWWLGNVWDDSSDFLCLPEAVWWLFFYWYPSVTLQSCVSEGCKPGKSSHNCQQNWVLQEAVPMHCHVTLAVFLSHDSLDALLCKETSIILTHYIWLHKYSDVCWTGKQSNDDGRSSLDYKQSTSRDDFGHMYKSHGALRAWRQTLSRCKKVIK